VGQLKHVATQAKTYLNQRLAQGRGAGEAIEIACASFQNSENYAPVSVGQLKYVASLFYDRFEAIHYNWYWQEGPSGTSQLGVAFSKYPWDLDEMGDNHAPANIGQLKYLFSFDLRDVSPTDFLKINNDGDNIPDWLEWDLINTDPDDLVRSTADITNDGDYDKDGRSNAAEMSATQQTRIDGVDSDLDGYSDGVDPNPLVYDASLGIERDAAPDASAQDLLPGITNLRSVHRKGLSDGNASTTDGPAIDSTTVRQISVHADEPNYLGTYPLVFAFEAPNVDTVPQGSNLKIAALRTKLEGFEYPFKARWNSLDGVDYLETWCGMAEDLNIPPSWRIANYIPQAVVRAQRKLAETLPTKDTLTWLDLKMSIPSNAATGGGNTNSLAAYSNTLQIDDAAVWRQNLIIPAGQRVSRTDRIEPWDLSGEEVVGTIKTNVKALVSPRFRKHSVRYTHLTGSTNRRVRISGSALPGSKPQSASESDSAQEHLYVDALTRALDHYTSDVHVPLGASELSLSVTRRQKQNSWNLANDLPVGSPELLVKHRMDEPFGPGWTSNLTAYALLDTSTDPDTLRRLKVIDPDGQSLEFFGPSDSSFFTAVPVGLPDENTFQHTISFQQEGDDPKALLVVRKKYGGTATYQKITSEAITTSLEALYLANNGAAHASNPTVAEMLGFPRENAVYRLIHVQNANFDQLRYEYESAPTDAYPNPLIPKAISDGRLPIEDTTRILIEQVPVNQPLPASSEFAAGLVSAVKDPMMNEVRYTYGDTPYNGFAAAAVGPVFYEYTSPINDGFQLRQRWLSSVSQNVKNDSVGLPARLEYLARYRYTVNKEYDKAERSIIRHFCMHKMIDGQDREWNFYYDFDVSKNSKVLMYADINASVPGLPSYLYNQGHDYIPIIKKKLRANAIPEVLPLAGEPLVVANIVLPGGPAVQPDMNWDQKGIISFATLPVQGSVAGYHLTPKSNPLPQDPFPYIFKFSLTTRVTNAERHYVDYVFGDAAAPAGQTGAFLASIKPLPGEMDETVLVGLTHMRIQYWNDSGVEIGREHFEFDPSAGMALKTVKDFSGNTVQYEYSNAWILPAPQAAFYSANVLGGTYGGVPFQILKYDDPSKEIRVYTGGPATLNRIKEFHYKLSNRALREEKDLSTGTTRKFEFKGDTTLRTREQLLRTGVEQPIKQTDWEYTNPTFPAFMTKATVSTWNQGCDKPDLVTTYTADAKGRLSWEHVQAPAPNGSDTTLSTQFFYDGNGNKTEVWHPRHHVSWYAGDGSAGGHRTLFKYDGRNRLLETERPAYGTELAAKTQIWYFKDSRKEKVRDPRGAYTFFGYDPAGRLTKTTRDLAALGTAGSRSSDIVTETWYDWTGLPVTTVDALGVGTETQYDEMGRPVAVTRGFGLVGDHQVPANVPTPTYTDLYFYTTDGNPLNTGNCGSSAFDSSGFKPVRISRMRGDSTAMEYDTTTVTYDCFYRETTRTLSHKDGRGGTSSYTTTLSYKDLTTGLPAGAPTGLPEGTPPGTSPQLAATSAVEKGDPINGNSRSWFDAARREIGTDLAEDATFSTKQTVRKFYTGFDATWKTETRGTAQTLRESFTQYDAAGRPYKSTSPAAPYYEQSFPTPLGAPHQSPDTSISWSASSPLGVGTTTCSWYDAAGNVVKTGDPRCVDATNPSVFTIHEFDGRNRLRRTITPLQVDVTDLGLDSSIQAETLRSYDLNGNLTVLTDSYGKTTTTVYDYANRPTSVTQPTVSISAISSAPPAMPPSMTNSAPATITTYDKAGHPLTVTDPNQKVTVNVYDALGRLYKTTDPTSSTTTFLYDAAGNRISVADGLNHLTIFKYDGLARPTEFDPPGKPPIITAYNDTLRTSTQTTGRGFIIKTTYDVRRRVVSVEHTGASAENLIYGYDEFRNLNSVSKTANPLDPTDLAAVVYTYDALNRVISERSCGLLHIYEYDRAGNRTRATINSGNASNKLVLRSSFDRLNRLVQIEETSPGPTRITKYEYDKLNRRFGLLLPNGLYERNSYDDASRLTDAITYSAWFPPGGSSTTARALTYYRDAAGNLRAQKETIGTNVRYTLNGYDNAGRLVHETVDFGSFNPGRVQQQTHYQYDAAGNRTYEWSYNQTPIAASHPTNTATAAFTYGLFNELTSVTRPGNPTTTYVYDNDGNRTSKTINAVQTTYTYDRLNRLVSVSNASGTNSYTYDYRHRRIVRQDAGQSSTQASVLSYAGGTSVQEFERGSGNFNTTSAPKVNYVRGSDLGGGVGGLLYTLRQNSGWQLTVNAYNARGDVIGQTNASKTATFSTAYQADGREILNSSSGANLDRQRANTKEYDPATTLLNEGFRYRDLETGVFMTRDPAGFIDGPNLYCYVKQNPWTMWDPDGLQSYGFPPMYAENRDFRLAHDQAVRDGLKGFFYDGPVNMVKGLLGLNPISGIKRGVDDIRKAAAHPDGFIAGNNEMAAERRQAFGAELKRLFTTPGGTGELMFNLATVVAGPASAEAKVASIPTKAEAPVATAAATTAGTQAVVSTIIKNGNSSASVMVEGGIAKVGIDYVEKASLPGLVKKIKSHAEDAGATSAKVDTGYIIDEDLAIDIGKKSQSGDKVFGGTVKQTEGGLTPRFEIDVPIDKKK